ncbi:MULTISPECIES: Na+/H+ antiporter NhaA [Streptomycetaceae]|nr:MULTISPECIES: Na+/H+ antiporter NhaA [Streptomycetaceae]
MPLPERNFVADALRTETVGGVLLLIAAVVALVLANTPARHGYAAVRDFAFGPGAVHLRLSVAHWCTDGLLTVFFFVAGIELKRELTTGELRSPAAAVLPVAAAVCGMLCPALTYLAVGGTHGGDLRGWAVPTATDIAFALAVLAVLGTALPAALRAFLLTLAVVDDLFAIVIIAVAYTATIRPVYLGLAVAGLVLFRLLLRKGVRGWYVYVPLAVVVWGLTHGSGVHATIAGVAMGLALPTGRGERVEHLVRPVSAGLAVPLFALFAAGVPVSGAALHAVFTAPETVGVVLGLFAGKILGVFGGSWLTARFTRAALGPELAWADVFAVACLGGIGFTVSLLIGELAFPVDPVLADEVKAAVLVGSLASAIAACVVLKLRNTRYRRLVEEEERDEDRDGVPDVYAQGDPAYHLRMAAIHEARAAEHRRLAEVTRRGTRPQDGPA